MPQVSKFLRSFKWKTGEEGYTHWCPGCGNMHLIYTKRAKPGHACWDFNGNLEKPNFNPSVRIFLPARTTREGRQIAEHTVCHYFLHDGVLKFCGDSGHKLKGQNLPLPELPEDYRGDRYHDGE